MTSGKKNTWEQFTFVINHFSDCKRSDCTVVQYRMLTEEAWDLLCWHFVSVSPAWIFRLRWCGWTDVVTFTDKWIKHEGKWVTDWMRDKGTDKLIFFSICNTAANSVITVTSGVIHNPDVIKCTKQKLCFSFIQIRPLKHLQFVLFWHSESTTIRQFMSFCSHSGYSHDQFSGLMTAGVAGVAGVSWLAT